MTFQRIGALTDLGSGTIMVSMTLVYALANVLSDGGDDSPRTVAIRHDPKAVSPDQANAERALIERIHAGDEEAFRVLMHEHFTVATKFAFRFVQEQDTAEDIAQDIFTRVWANRRSWDPQTSIRAYLLGSVRHRALDILKHRGVEVQYAIAEAAAGESGVDAVGGDRLDQKAELAVLHRAVLALPERRRVALSLRYEHGLSHAEVGAALGVSAKAAKELIVRTLDALRATLNRLR